MRRRDERRRRRIGLPLVDPPAGAAGGRRRGKLRVKGDSTRGREEGGRSARERGTGAGRGRFPLVSSP